MSNPEISESAKTFTSRESTSSHALNEVNDLRKHSQPASGQTDSTRGAHGGFLEIPSINQIIQGFENLNNRFQIPMPDEHKRDEAMNNAAKGIESVAKSPTAQTIENIAGQGKIDDGPAKAVNGVLDPISNGILGTIGKGVDGIIHNPTVQQGVMGLGNLLDRLPHLPETH